MPGMPGFRGHHTAEQLAANARRDIEVLRRYEAGETLAGIGVVIGLSRERIRQIVRASGVAMPWDYKCAVTGCETSPRTPNQYCQSHQRRFERYGDPLGTKPRLMDQHGTLASYKGGGPSRHERRWVDLLVRWLRFRRRRITRCRLESPTPAVDALTNRTTSGRLGAAFEPHSMPPWPAGQRPLKVHPSASAAMSISRAPMSWRSDASAGTRDPQRPSRTPPRRTPPPACRRRESPLRWVHWRSCPRP